MDSKVLEEGAGMTRVLRGDQVDFFEDTEGPQRDVLSIPDGCGDDKECALFWLWVRRCHNSLKSLTNRQNSISGRIDQEGKGKKMIKKMIDKSCKNP